MSTVVKQRRKSSPYRPQLTVYRTARGDAGNYNWKAKFDWTTGGYVGITQLTGLKDDELNRVLLSPKQVKALLAFVEEKRRNPPRSVR